MTNLNNNLIVQQLELQKKEKKDDSKPVGRSVVTKNLLPKDSEKGNKEEEDQKLENTEFPNPKIFFARLSIWGGLFSAFAILQLITLGMKLNNEINWYWGHVFTFAWIFLGMISMIVIASYVGVYFDLKTKWLSCGSATFLLFIVSSAFVQLALLSYWLNRYESGASWALIFLPSYFSIALCFALVFAYITWPRDAYNIAFSRGTITVNKLLISESKSNSLFIPFAELCGNKREYEYTMTDESMAEAGIAKWFFHVAILVFLIGISGTLILSVIFLEQHCMSSVEEVTCGIPLWVVFLPIWITSCFILIPFSGLDFYHKAKMTREQYVAPSDSHIDSFFNHQGAFAFCSLTTLFVTQSALIWAAMEYAWETSWHIVFLPFYISFSVILLFSMCFCKNDYDSSSLTSVLDDE